MLSAGKAAPCFFAFNQDGSRICLRDFLGKKSVVLHFFPWSKLQEHVLIL